MQCNALSSVVAINFGVRQGSTVFPFLLRDTCTTQSAVLLRSVVRLSVRDVELSWSHRLEYFEN